MSDALLWVQGLTAGYVKGLPILRDVSIRAARGALTAIIGPNGAGKSTLIKAIAGLAGVSAGRVLLAGEDITGLRPDQMSARNLSYVPQTDNVFRSLSVRQNLELALGGRDAAAAARIAELFERFPALADKQGFKAATLSGGQRQFLAIAMALATRPHLILMDEPSAGLSPKATEEVLDDVRALTRSGVTVLLVEQNVKQALRRADHCYVLAEGRNQIDGDAQEMLQGSELGRIYLGQQRFAPA